MKGVTFILGDEPISNCPPYTYVDAVVAPAYETFFVAVGLLFVKRSFC